VTRDENNKNNNNNNIDNLLTPWSRVLLEKLLQLLQLFKEFPAFMEAVSLLPYSQVPATYPYPDSAPSSLHNPLPLPEDPS
jgi:hypothetical protein